MAKHKALVIVESPAKARKISGFLGKDYQVMASVGHVRDLPSSAAEIPEAVKKESWSKLAIDVTNEFKPVYIIPSGKKKTVRELKTALKDADSLIIATDEDREGESIGWHLVDLLQPKVPVSRMVFGEITKTAILEALGNTRELDENLVQAQETRRVLDRLFGYTLSPLLWRKIPQKQRLSAGRVQSVAVRILVQREIERSKFRSAIYWDLKADLNSPQGALFEATLATVGGTRVASGKDFDENTGQLKPTANVLLLDETTAQELHARVSAADWSVTQVESKTRTERPSPPFTTSTLQQAAGNRLGMSTRQTMSIAQRLYEEGHITYMRTDSVSLSGEAIGAARRKVEADFGAENLSPEPRNFTTKSKGAQEAHEAIRPAGTAMKTASELGLSGQEWRLYDLIWKRTVATQMADAKKLQQTVTIQAADAEFRANGQHIVFAGWLLAYGTGESESTSDAKDKEKEKALPPLNEADALKLADLESLSHETRPPARYTEPSLVRKLESEGVGRPSTYASIIGTIQDRGYVQKQGKQLVPTFTAMAVTKLLEEHFTKLVDYRFTARMEEQLDEVAAGEAERLPYLTEFFCGDDGLEHQVKTHEEEIDLREACKLKLDGITADIRIGRSQPFLQLMEGEEAVNVFLPADIAPADVTEELAQELIERRKRGPKELGMHPDEGLPIYVKDGPFGEYLQMGEDPVEDGPKPKRCSIPKHVDSESIELGTAVSYLALPRQLGKHPETGNVVNAGIGKFGPYVTSRKDGRQVFKSLAKEHDVLTVDLDQAVQLLAEVKPRGPAPPLKELGKHPEDGELVAVYEGRYGMYVKHGSVNATIPKEREVDSVTLEEALDWIAERAAKGGGRRKKAAKKKASKKKAAKKKSAKKKSAKKKAAKKQAE